MQAFESGDSVIGTTWQVIANRSAPRTGVPVKAVLPEEGSTGWSDTWMISAKAEHPNCSVRVDELDQLARDQAQVAEWFGEAPANTKACDLTTDKGFCDIYHATTLTTPTQIHYWTTPIEQCVDGSGDKCTAYDEWVDEWTQIKG